VNRGDHGKLLAEYLKMGKGEADSGKLSMIDLDDGVSRELKSSASDCVSLSKSLLEKGKQGEDIESLLEMNLHVAIELERVANEIDAKGFKKTSKSIEQCFEKERAGLLHEIRVLEKKSQELALTKDKLASSMGKVSRASQRTNKLREELDECKAMLVAEKLRSQRFKKDLESREQTIRELESAQRRSLSMRQEMEESLCEELSENSRQFKERERVLLNRSSELELHSQMQSGELHKAKMVVQELESKLELLKSTNKENAYSQEIQELRTELNRSKIAETRTRSNLHAMEELNNELKLRVISMETRCDSSLNDLRKINEESRSHLREKQLELDALRSTHARTLSRVNTLTVQVEQGRKENLSLSGLVESLRGQLSMVDREKTKTRVRAEQAESESIALENLHVESVAKMEAVESQVSTLHDRLDMSMKENFELETENRKLTEELGATREQLFSQVNRSGYLSPTNKSSPASIGRSPGSVFGSPTSVRSLGRLSPRNVLGSPRCFTGSPTSRNSGSPRPVSSPPRASRTSPTSSPRRIGSPSPTRRSRSLSPTRQHSPSPRRHNAHNMMLFEDLESMRYRYVSELQVSEANVSRLEKMLEEETQKCKERGAIIEEQRRTIHQLSM